MPLPRRDLRPEAARTISTSVASGSPRRGCAAEIYPRQRLQTAGRRALSFVQDERWAAGILARRSTGDGVALRRDCALERIFRRPARFCGTTGTLSAIDAEQLLG
jgi:hypothetical protein